MPPQNTPLPDMNLVSYRLKEIESNLEKNIEKLSSKIDLLLAELNKSAIAQSEAKVKVEKLEVEVAGLIKTDESLKQELTALRVSVAEKITWGAGGGAIAGLIIKLVETSTGG
jgi:hypothetical protein